MSSNSYEICHTDEPTTLSEQPSKEYLNKNKRVLEETDLQREDDGWGNGVEDDGWGIEDGDGDWGDIEEADLVKPVTNQQEAKLRTHTFDLQEVHLYHSCFI